MSFVAYENRVERDGQVVYQLKSGGPDPLKWAVERSGKRENVYVGYMATKLWVQLGENYRRHEVVRNEPIRCQIRGLNKNSGIRSVMFGDKGGGINRIAFTDMTIDGRGRLRPWVPSEGAKGGKIIVKRVTLRSTPGETQFGFRSAGSFTNIYVDVHCPDGGKEWSFYDDYGPGHNRYIRCTGNNWWRGGIQRVLRPFKHADTHLDPDGITDIYRCEFYNYGSAGGAGISLNGFWGMANVANCVFDSKHDTSAIVCTYDAKQNLQTNPTAPLGQRGPIIGKGFITPSLRAGQVLNVIENNIYLPTTKRSVMNIDSLDELNITESRGDTGMVESNKWAVDLESNGHGSSQWRDLSIGKITMNGSFSHWKSQGFRRRLATFLPQTYGAR